MEVESTEAAAARERKRKRDVVAAAGVGDEEEEEAVYEGIAEESVEELMRWLEMEISPAPETTKEEAAAAPPLGFVTINGNEESCGPSFSAASSTVMASVDTRGGAPPAPPLPWPLPPPPAASAEFELNDCEEWLVELLTGGPAVAVAVEDAVVARA